MITIPSKERLEVIATYSRFLPLKFLHVLHPMQQRSCSYSTNYVGATMSGTVAISSGCETSLLSAVANVGPVSIAVDASNNAFRVS